MISFYSVPIFIAATMSLLLGIFVYSKKRADFLNISLALLCFSIAIWLFSYSIIYSSRNEQQALFWARNSYLGIIFIPTTIYQLAIGILGIKDRKKLVLFYSICFLFVFLSRTNIFFDRVKIFFWGYYPQAAILYFPFLIYFFGVYSYGTLLLGLALLRRNLKILKRNQILYVFFAYIVGSFASVDFLGKYGIEFYPFGYICMVLVVFIFAYAIIRYRLADISVVITRTGIFVAVYSLILGIPFFIGYRFQLYLTSILNNNWWLGPLISSTILATIGPFVYLYFDKKTQDKLLKEQRGYQNILRNASSGMIRIKDLNRLLNLIVHVVTKTVKIRNAAIYLFDKENDCYALQAIRGDGITKQVEKTVDVGSPLIWTMTYRRSFVVTEEETMRLSDEQDNISLLKLNEQLLSLGADLVVPSFVDERLIGFIVLGEKISKKLYSQDDMNVFSVLANQAALAIENAQFYDEIKQTHEQLFQAEKLATIGTMADGLSHQINNRFHALSLISGDALDIINTSDLANVSPEVKQLVADLKDALQKIQNNVLQGGEVVKGLLKYSRPGESGFEAIDFKDVLKGALDMVQYKIKLIEIDFLEKIVPNLPKIHGNLTQLQEVFFNLIDNAYDATRERKTTLKEKDYKGRIEVIAHVNEKNNIEINVIDNGMGIKDLDKKKMFTPFFTTKATAKKGTGLGLYVIKKIVSAHNGTISVGSTYEKGTHFVIEFPLNHEIPVKTT